MAAKVAVPVGAGAEQVAAAIDAAEERVRAAVPLKAQIYLEPDIFHEGLARDDGAAPAAQQPQ